MPDIQCWQSMLTTSGTVEAIWGNIWPLLTKSQKTLLTEWLSNMDPRDASASKKRDLREKWGLIEDPFKSLWGLLVVIFIKIPTGFKSAYLQHYKSAFIRCGRTVTCVLCNSISQEIHIIQQFNPANKFKFPSTRWDNEASCANWELNEDHFGSLVLMRTKSSIEDLYGSTTYSIPRFAETI